MKWDKITLQNIKKIFYVLMICILGFFLFMQFFGANEQKSEHNSIDSIYYPGTFVWEKEDGTYEEITIPGVYDVLPGKTMVISTILPDDYTDTTIAIRSSLQDIKFYIDDELREEYTTQDTRLSGKNSASRYIFCNTSYLDAGKKLTIELTTHTANYSGVVNQLFSGNQANIWQYIYNQYGASSYIAFFILFAGLTTVLFSAALKFVYHKNFDMEYFGWATVMGSVWMLGESKIRQILVPNASSLASLCFIMIMLCPLPLLFYADSIQDGLHRRLYIKTSIFVLFNFTVCSFLHIAGILDFIETLPIGQIILGLVFMMVLIHLYNYLRKNHSRIDDLLLFGLFLVLVCFIIESISVYFITFVTGVFIGLGMLFLLFINILRTVLNIQHIEANRQKEEIEKEQKRNEEMTLQMMRSLVMTIEAKNEYKLIGQVFETYWLVEFHDNLYIIDQHAAHERVLYERTLKSMKTREFTSQMISPPIVLDLSMQEAELLNRYMDQFTRIGFEFEEFGQESYAVRAVPDNLFGIAKKDLLLQMLDSLSDEIHRNLSPDMIDEKVASMSCKAAVKGNMKLSAAEVDSLIGELLTLENPYHCPHGRPTIIAMSKRELEKKFKRIV